MTSTLPVDEEEVSAPRFPRVRAVAERIPPSMRLPLGLFLLFLFAFASAILPMFLLRGGERAEIAGMQSSSGVVGQTTAIDLGIDNTGDTVISPICLSALFDLPVDVKSVSFQGLDTVPFKDGRACGGALSGQETISVVMTVIPRQAGTVHVRMVATKNAKEIGPAVVRELDVSAR